MGVGVCSLVFMLLSSFISPNAGHAQTVRITSPNGGENWRIGETQKISWTFSGLSSGSCFYVDLLHNGKSIGTIFTNRCSISSWDWKVGQLQSGTVAPGPGYKIRIQTVGGIFDESDGAFSLVGAGQPPPTSSTQKKLGAELQKSFPDVKPKVAQQTPSSMPKSSLKRPPGESSGSSSYHSPMPKVELLSVEVIGQGNRTKTFPNRGSITIEKDDVKDSIDIYWWYALDIRYKLINSGGRETSGKVSLNHHAPCAVMDSKVEGDAYNLKPLETKTFTKRFFMTACNYESIFKILDLSGKELFQGNIVSAPSLLNWLGWPSILHAQAIGGTQSSDRKVRVSCYLNNGGGGPVKRNWSLTYKVTHPHGGTVFVKTWDYNQFPTGGKQGPVGEFYPIYGGDIYTFDCILESAYPIFVDCVRSGRASPTGMRLNKLEYSVNLLLH